MDKTIALNVQTLNFVAGSIIPLLVGLVAKKVASSGLKAVLNAALSAIAGGVAVAIAANGAVHVNEVVVSMVTTFITSAAVYYGLWKPTGVAATVTEKTADFGIAGPSLETAEKT